MEVGGGTPGAFCSYRSDLWVGSPWHGPRMRQEPHHKADGIYREDHMLISKARRLVWLLQQPWAW
jgi:hypothetical protein